MGNNRIDSVLGQRVNYPQTYYPDVLVAVERQLNRDSLHITADILPFTGVDVWHAYEVSCLTNNGLPTAGVIKIAYPCTSKYIVESKSFKLYLNSFNMQPLGATAEEATDEMCRRVRRDLEELLCTDVAVVYHECGTATADLPIDGYTLLERVPEVRDAKFDKYEESPDFLVSSGVSGRERLMSNLLRSNCRVTFQPDWGTILVDIEGQMLPDRASLLKYIVSLRGENHFHEEICELVFCRLQETFRPIRLMVACIYTRRGGIDICPMRATHEDMIWKDLASPEVLSQKLTRS